MGVIRVIGFMILLVGSMNLMPGWGTIPPAMAQSDSEEATYIRPRLACPEELDDLIPLMLRDLPSYANRVTQRAYIDDFRLTQNIPGYVLIAGRAEYEPIALTTRQYDPVFADDTTDQVFFTTLDRQYTADGLVTLQNYHWLFLTRSEVGWRVVLMFSRLGDVSSDEPPTPPHDSSQGVLARAIRLWLRDCYAGSVAPP